MSGGLRSGAPTGQQCQNNNLEVGQCFGCETVIANPVDRRPSHGQPGFEVSHVEQAPHGAAHPGENLSDGAELALLEAAEKRRRHEARS